MLRVRFPLLLASLLLSLCVLAVAASSPLVSFRAVGPFNVDESTEYNSRYPPGTPHRHIGVGAVVRMVMMSADVAYVASVNGGIWRTDDYHNATALAEQGGPHWRFISGAAPCQAVGGFDAVPGAGAAGSADTLAFGCGSLSSFEGSGGEPGRVMISRDGGASWTVTTFHTSLMAAKGGVVGLAKITGLRLVQRAGAAAAAPPRIVVSSDSFFSASGWTTGGGVWISDDAGSSWTQSYASSVGIVQLQPDALSAVGQPTNSSRLWIMESRFLQPLLSSSDAGSTWQPASIGMDLPQACFNLTAAESAATNWNGTRMNAAFSSSRTPAGAGNVFVAIYATAPSRPEKICYVYFQSRMAETDATPQWSFVNNGPQSDILSDQGYAFFATLADPDPAFGSTFYFSSFSSPAWRVELTPAVEGSPANWTRMDLSTPELNSAHGDTRSFTWDSFVTPAALVSSEDGGMWSRATPREPGLFTRWNGDLAINEPVKVAYDPRSNTVFSASQDNCVLVQYISADITQSSGRFYSLVPGDGVFVAVDSTSNPSRLLSSTQNLESFTALELDGSNSWLVPTSKIGFVGGGSVITDHTGAYSEGAVAALNSAQMNQSMVCGETDCALFTIPIPSVRAPDVTTMNVDPTQLPFQVYAVGGFDNELPLPRLLVGVNGQAGLIYTMLDWSVPASAVSRPVPWPQNSTLVVTALAINARNYRHIACTVVSAELHASAWVSFDFGASWRAAGPENLRVASGGIVDASMGGLVFTPFNVSATDASQSALLVGTQHGIYSSFSNDAGCSSGDGTACAWYRVDANLPSSVMTHLSYEPTSDVLVVGMLGRGVYVTPSKLLQPDALRISQQVQAQWAAIEAAANPPPGPVVPAEDTPSNVSWALLGALLGIAGGLCFLLIVMRVVCKPGAATHVRPAPLRLNTAPVEAGTELSPMSQI